MSTRVDTSTLTRETSERIPLTRILMGTIVAIVVAAILNVIVFYIGDAAGAFPDDFRFDPPMGGDNQSIGVGEVIFATFTNLVVAGVVFAIINRFSRRPARVFMWVAIVVFLFSLLQPLMLEDAPNDMVAFLMAMHAVAAVVIVAVLTRVASMTPGASATA